MISISSSQPSGHGTSFAPHLKSITEDDASGFVLLTDIVPDVLLDIRYFSTFNFVGKRIDGYLQPIALLSREAAQALQSVSQYMIQQGFRFKIFDAYRPQMAVNHFMRWANDPADIKMKDFFYPDLKKDTLFPNGYIAARSGHSRGSTVDLTLFDMSTQQDLDMGGTFDFFGERSHPGFTGVTEKQFENRMFLQSAMVQHGFKPYDQEWWHFTLADEPYPNTYFTFPIHESSVQHRHADKGDRST